PAQTAWLSQKRGAPSEAPLGAEGTVLAFLPLAFSAGPSESQGGHRPRRPSTASRGHDRGSERAKYVRQARLGAATSTFWLGRWTACPHQPHLPSSRDSPTTLAVKRGSAEGSAFNR